MTLESTLQAAGVDAAARHNDEWFAIDFFEDGETQEPGTIIHEYQGQRFQVWLNGYFRQCAEEDCDRRS